MALKTLGKYELLEEIGRGGFGTVYRARDITLDVERAVKVLHPALVADHAFIERFTREAKYAARLKHPHIVPVYDLGESEGRFHLAMEHMPGGSLKDLLAKESRLPFEHALEITRQIANALDYAHKQGLIHRDIKPGNILFEDEPGEGKKLVARLADFGFAKAFSGASSASYSISGTMIGTPAYMAPEVWRGKEATPATDEYSLACVFYELITGEVLFHGESPPEIMTKHILDGPKFPEIWPEGVPIEISKILYQALDKEPEKRYATPGDFVAKIESEIYSTKITRLIGEGHEALAQKTWSRVEELASRIEELGEEGKQASISLRERLALAKQQEDKRTRQEAEAHTRRKLDEQARLEAKKKEQEIARLLSKATAALERESWNQVEQISTKLGQLGDEGRAAALDLHTQLVQAQQDAVERARRKEEEQARIVAKKRVKEITRLLDGTKAALDRESWGLVEKMTITLGQLGDEGQAAALDVRERLKKARLKAEERARHDAEEKVRQEREKKAKEIYRLLDHAKTALDKGAWKKVERICVLIEKLGEEGRVEANKLQDRLVQARQVAQEPQKERIGKPERVILATKLSRFKAKLMHSRFRWVVVGGLAVVLVSLLIIWISFRAPSLSAFPTNTPSTITTMALTQLPEPTVTTSLIGTAVSLFGAQLKTLEGHTDNVYALAFSLDGQILASGAKDRTIRLWRVSDGNLLHTLKGHTGNIWSVAFSPNGQILASGSADYTVRLWQVADGALIHTLEGHVGDILSVAFSPDGQILASGSLADSVKLWQVSDGSLLRTLEGHTNSVYSVAFSPDGQVLASGSSDDSVRIWRVKDDNLIRTLKGHTGGVLTLAFSPDGQTLASGSLDNTVRLWRVSDGSLIRTLQGHKSGVLSVAFSPEGQILASGSEDGTIRFWQVADGTTLLSLEGYYDRAYSVAFSLAGTSIALGYLDNTIRLWSINP